MAVTINLTKTDAERLEAASRALGFSSTSEFARYAVERALEDRRGKETVANRGSRPLGRGRKTPPARRPRRNR